MGWNGSECESRRRVVPGKLLEVRGPGGSVPDIPLENESIQLAHRDDEVLLDLMVKRPNCIYFDASTKPGVIQSRCS